MAQAKSRWVLSACDMCYSACGIKVKVQEDLVTLIEGDPNCPHNVGKLCAKGNAGLISLYDPYRVKVPVKRTNPEKGVGVDPKWQEISWEEALEIIVPRLKAIRADDPRKLALSTFDQHALYLLEPWGLAFGTPNTTWVGYYCGNYLHASMYLTNGSFHSDFDIQYCNYCILLGNQHGFMAGLNPNLNTQKMADARQRGLRVVVVDPICTPAAAKANQWVPIRPGTDAALMLGMINLLVNELGLYDREFLKNRTNASYLVGPDGGYVKDKAGKPLIWDQADNQAKPFDAPIKDAALEGRYIVDEIRYQPAFELLKEHVSLYTPERVAAITTIPEGTIRQMAEDFGREAKIGATLQFDGHNIPYRPVAVNIYRGAGAHKHGALTALAVQTLNMIVGAFYVPGGHRGVNIIGPGGKWQPGMSKDGLIKPPPTLGHKADYYDFEVGLPQTLGLHELFPISTNRSPMCQMSVMNPERFKLPYKLEVLIVCRRNLMTNNANLQANEEMFKKIPFVVNFAIHFDEVTDFADIVLPEAHSLERLDLFPNRAFLSISPSSGKFYWGLRQPVAKVVPQARRWLDVLWEIADRMGFLPDLYRMMNASWGLKGPYALDPDKKYTWEEMYDRHARATVGDDKGLEWFKTHGYFSVDRNLEERFPGPFIQGRFPVYYENIKRAGEELEHLSKQHGLDWDISDYQPLPDWKPCHREDEDDYDLYAINYKVPFHTFSYTSQNPWLNELAQHVYFVYEIVVNADTARKKGIAEGDRIVVQSKVARVQGIAHVTECIQPETVGIAGVFGSWARGKPVARGQGVHFNSLVPMSMEHIDYVSSGVDSCVKVRISKAEQAGA